MPKREIIKTINLQVLFDHYKCPEILVDVGLGGQLFPDAGFFRFGEHAICFGRSTAGYRSTDPAGSLYDVDQDVRIEGSVVQLPFEPASAIDNLRLERYVSHSNGSYMRPIPRETVRAAYYAVRPLLPIAIRRHFQRFSLRGWQNIPFPCWPVDRSVEEIFERLLIISMKAQGLSEVPFIWFWPAGAPSCLMMTHDIETASGLDFCTKLMDLNDSFGMKASFQVVPEKRYLVPEGLLRNIRERGFEICVHDLNHDGHLYSDRDEFLRRVKQINQYGRKFGAQGFRAGAMYRNLDWYAALEFKYDMSVSNVAHLDPQRGGCCTVFPYFVGDILELPLTTVQDYPLFYILGQNCLTLWKTQIRLILEKYGLVSFIVHPDYITSARNQQTYKDLLTYLSQLCTTEKLWMALPGEINRWWRARGQMKLISDDGRWRIEGPEAERARIAYARLENEQLVYRIENNSVNQ